MLPVDLDCPFLIAPLVFSNLYKDNNNKKKKNICSVLDKIGLIVNIIDKTGKDIDNGKLKYTLIILIKIN